MKGEKKTSDNELTRRDLVRNTAVSLAAMSAMNASKPDLRPEKYEFGGLSLRPVAIPGKTSLI